MPWPPVWDDVEAVPYATMSFVWNIQEVVPYNETVLKNPPPLSPFLVYTQGTGFAVTHPIKRRKRRKL